MFKKIEIKPIHFIAAILVLVLLMLMQCNRISKLKVKNTALENKVVRVKANVDAKSDSIETYINEKGYYINEIQGYQYTVKELETENKGLLKDYQKALADVVELKNLNQLLRTELSIKETDTVYATVKNDTTLIFKDSTNYGDDNWRKFDATVNVFTEGDSLTGGLGTFDYTQNIKLYAGIEAIDGRRHINISTKYPGLNFKTIEGISVIEDELNAEKKKKRGRICIGVGGGYGILFGPNNQILYGPQLGVSIIYSPKWLQF